jgi:hypothetical protein
VTIGIISKRFRKEIVEPRVGFEFVPHGTDVHEVPRRSAYEADAIAAKPPRLD